VSAIILPDGTRFVPQQWHDNAINVIPSHNEALVTCRLCGEMKIVPDAKIRTPQTSQMTISQVAARLKCGKCGAKDAQLQFGYIAGDPPEF
jgi:hypothetical protein